MVPSQDRRQFARAEAKWPVTIISPDSQTLGKINSISQVGASIYCDKLPSTAQELRLEIQPPNRQPIIVLAKPIWSVDADTTESSYRFVFGVQFEYISEVDLQFLGDIVVKQSH
jgi:hypothetical protein